MINNGDIVYFLLNGYVLNGKVIDKNQKEDEYSFSIEGYGSCGGKHIISSRQIHKTIFLTEDEALLYKDNPQMYIQSSC